MTRTKVIMLLTFVLAMGAGVGVGVVGSRTMPRSGGGPSWLIQELDLTPKQQEEMKKIWMELASTRGAEFRDEMRALQQERDTAVAQMLDAQQQEKYAQINQIFMEKVMELGKRVETEFLAAGEKTRQLLNENQQKRYDLLVEQFRSQHANGDWFGMSMRGMGPRGMGSPGVFPPGMQPRMPATPESDVK